MWFLEVREKGYEGLFAAGNTQSFCRKALAFHRAGLWAAAQLGKDGHPADAYAGDIVRRLARAYGDECAIRKLVRDLGGKVEEIQVRNKLDEFMGSPA